MMIVSVLRIAFIVFMAIGYLSVIYGSLIAGHKNNPVTWFLWAALDGAALWGSYYQGEDITLALTFVIGSVVTLFAILVRGGFSWSRVETFTLILVLTCFALTKVGTTNTVIWASGIALSVAGIPWFVFLWKAPSIDMQTKIATVVYFLAMACSFTADWVGGGSRVISGCSLVFWTIGIYIVFFRRRPRTYASVGRSWTG